MARNQKELEALADRARQGSRDHLVAFREEFFPSLIQMVEQVRCNGGYDLPAHRRIRSALAAVQNRMPAGECLSERALVTATAQWLWQQTEAWLQPGDALETVRG